VSAPGRGGDDPALRPGALRPTSPSSLLGWSLAGLVLGWVLHAVADRVGFVPPLVSWVQPFALVLLAAILGYTAYATNRAVHLRRQVLSAQQAMNRFILARSCALVSALVAGGYLVYGLSWVGDPAELADDRLLRCGVACVAGLLAMVAALLLERACRVPTDRDGDGTGADAG